MLDKLKLLRRRKRALRPFDLILFLVFFFYAVGACTAAASNNYICWNASAPVQVSVLPALSNPGNTGSYCADLNALSSKGSLLSNWACANNYDLKAEAVLTQADFRASVSGNCLYAANSSAPVGLACNGTPDWVVEPVSVAMPATAADIANADISGFRLHNTTGQCLELVNTATVAAATCRARNDANFNSQIWVFTGANGGNQLLQSKVTTTDASTGALIQYCLTESIGTVAVGACQADTDTVPTNEQWLVTVGVPQQEHWINFYENFNGTQYSYSDTPPSASAIPAFVVLEAPAAAAMAVYRDSSSHLFLCGDDSVSCGQVAFYAPLPPAASANAWNRLPVYEFRAAGFTAPRYSTSFGVGTGWVRQPAVAFYAYLNQEAAAARVNEVISATNAALAGNQVTDTTQMPSLQINYAEDSTDTVRYEYTAPVLTIRSSAAVRPDREEMLHVIGHMAVETILGPLSGDDVCLYDPNAPDTGSTSDYFHRSGSLLMGDWEPEACVFREAWAEVFTREMLNNKVGLATRYGGASVPASTSSNSTQARALAIPVLYLLIGFFFAIAAVDATLITYTHTHYLADPFPGGMVRATGNGACATPNANGTCTAPDLGGTGGDSISDFFDRNKDASENYLQMELDVCEGDPRPAECMDMQNYLKNDSSATCTVIDTSDQLVSTACGSTGPIACVSTVVDSSFPKLTAADYPYREAVEACVSEYGFNAQPMDSGTKRPRSQINTTANANAAGKQFGIGEYNNRSNKRVRMAYGKRALDTVTAVEKQLEALSKKNNYLLIHSINVGAGSCHIAQCLTKDATNSANDTSESVFIDCGTVGSTDPYLDRQTVRAYADYNAVFNKGARPSVVVTHPHADHFSYLKDVFGATQPYQIWLGGNLAHYQNPFGGWWRGFLGQANNTIRVNGALAVANLAPLTNGPQNLKTFAGCLVGGKHPSLDIITVNNAGMDGDDNANSAVVKLTVPKTFAAIIPGDAVGTTEDAARAVGDFTPANFTKGRFLAASHHGSSEENSNTLNWVTYVKPTHVVYSSGRRGNFRHPRCEIYTRYNTAPSLAAVPVHNLACDPDIYGQTSNTPVKGHYSTMSSGIVVVGIGIQKTTGAVTQVLIKER